VFVSNVLNGTVTRLDLSIDEASVRVSSSTRIASGYTHRFDPAALVIGPTGLAYDADHDVLYVASTGDNKVFAIDHAGAASKDAGTGRVVYTDNVHLHGPLGLALAPNGHLITANGDAVNAGGMQNELVEFTIDGKFVAQFQVDSGAGGGAFGLAFGRSGGEIRFAAVDDDQNTLDVWTLGPH
jgi:DNA-binding beta-propeller fold protein YncE